MSSYEPKDSQGNAVDPYHIRKYFEPLRVVDGAGFTRCRLRPRPTLGPRGFGQLPAERR